MSFCRCMKCGEEGPIQRWRESVIRENVSVREDYINTAYQKTGLLIILIIYSTYVLYNYDESIYIIIYIYHIILTMMKQYYSAIQHFDIVYVCCTGHGCLLLQTISPSTNARFAVNNWHRMNKRGGCN
jgi:hypothetical protein